MSVWTEHADALRKAYARDANPVRFELVTRAIRMEVSDAIRVADVGGGFGRQAIYLAREGHSVTVLDPDASMLLLARRNLQHEAPDVRARVAFVMGPGESASALLGAGFDLVCCHSVLSYLADPSPLLIELVRLVRPGGLISVLSVNPDAIAMRSGLQGRWPDTVASLEANDNVDRALLSAHFHGRESITRILEDAGTQVKMWYGVGVFTDHLTDKRSLEGAAEPSRAEWLAGGRDPYRQVARCFHLLAERGRSR